MAPRTRRAAGGELDLIASIRTAAGVARGAVQLGIGDDCAILQPPHGDEILVTTDFSLEGRHFRRDWHPGRSAGHRCLARGLSDLAAMGAQPISAFLSLAVPTSLRQTVAGRRWLEAFLAGLLTLAERTDTQLSGGDTAAAPGDAVLADIVLVGSAPRGRALRRSGARPGDVLYATGALGGAAAELGALQAKPRSFHAATPDGTHPHLFPEPRLQVGAALLARKLATAAIDVSDGLSTDLRHLCGASGTGAVLEADALPIQPLAAPAGDGGLAAALHGGEDYELLFTARPQTRMPSAIAGVPITRIGTITAEPAILLRSKGRDVPLRAGGWEHGL